MARPKKNKNELTEVATETAKIKPKRQYNKSKAAKSEKSEVVAETAEIKPKRQYNKSKAAKAEKSEVVAETAEIKPKRQYNKSKAANSEVVAETAEIKPKRQYNKSKVAKSENSEVVAETAKSKPKRQYNKSKAAKVAKSENTEVVAETAKVETTETKTTQPENSTENSKYLTLLDEYNALKVLIESLKTQNQLLQTEIEQLKETVVPQKTVTEIENENLNEKLGNCVIKIKAPDGNYLCTAGNDIVLGAKKPTANKYLFKVIYRPKTTNTFIVDANNENNFLTFDKATQQISFSEGNKYSRVVISESDGKYKIGLKQLKNYNFFVEDKKLKAGKTADSYFDIEIIE